MGSHSARTVTAYDDTTIAAGAHDTNPLPQTSQALFILTAGNIRYINAAGRDSGVIAVPLGLYPVQMKQIFSGTLTAVGRIFYDKDKG